MRHRVYVHQDDIVLVDLFIGFCNFEEKGVISVRYSDEFVRELITHQEIPESFTVKNETQVLDTHHRP